MKRAAWAGGCGALFVLVYGACSWLTAQRAGVGTLQFDWERGLPFVPWMILPYWSIDLFFIGSFFLCTESRDLRRLGGRISAAILGAGVCFLLVPLTTTFQRPELSGVWKPLFDALWSFDRPFNQFPSLHIALLVILGEHYGRHTRGLLRTVLRIWFALVAASTLLTWQHHAIDLAGGVVLGLLSLHVVGTPWERFAAATNRRVGVYYLLGSVVAALLAVALPPAGLLLLWPAVSLALVALGYFGAGAAVYGKTGPTLPLPARLLLAPCLTGQWISWARYRRQSPLFSEVAPGVLLGALPTDAEARDAVAQGVRAVLDLTAEFSEAGPFRCVEIRQIPVLDLTAPTPAQLEEAAEFIESESRLGKVYVHCKAGYSRSAAAVGAWLLGTGRATSVEDAVAQLRRARPSIMVRPEVRLALGSCAQAEPRV